MFQRRHGLKPAPRHILIPLAFALLHTAIASAQFDGQQPIVHKVNSTTDRMEMIVNSSRMLTLDHKIPRAQVNNRELLDLTPLSPTEIQVFAKKPGVTQINLWDDAGKVHSVDVIILGDARELDMLLKTQFPQSSIKVTPLANSVVLSGYVERNDHVAQIIRMAEDYYPKVISNIEVGGVQQILLHVQVMEVSRTKLRALGTDFAFSNGSGYVVSSVGGLINATAASVGTSAGSGDTVRFGFVDGNTQFLGFIEALRKNQMAKVLAEPTLVTVSGRPAYFKAGGEFPILVPQSLGTVSIEYKEFGTRVDFLPIVLGNGNIRLEVRPQVSEVDPTRSVIVGGASIPGIRTREVDTGVEMRAGQTLALAGLVQTRIDADTSGLPWLADLPYIGVPFRRNREQANEIELLIMVTPELVEALDPHEVPPCKPGMSTVSPEDFDFYLRGHLEVPSCGPCGPGGNCPTGGETFQQGIPAGPIEMEQGRSFEDIGRPHPARQPAPRGATPRQAPAVQPTPAVQPQSGPALPGSVRTPSGQVRAQPASSRRPGAGEIVIDEPQPPMPPREGPNNRYIQPQPRAATQIPTGQGNPGFIGPTGYDVLK